MKKTENNLHNTLCTFKNLEKATFITHKKDIDLSGLLCLDHLKEVMFCACSSYFMISFLKRLSKA